VDLEHVETTLLTWVTILRLLVKVTPKTLKEVTRVMVESGGGGKLVDRRLVKTILWVLDEFRQRLLVVAQELIWLSSRGIDKELEDGTKR